VGPLDVAVPTPAAFPADVPVYPGARLTAGASFSANGVTTWGLEWETFDPVDKVKAFYTSNSKFAGILGADGSSGFTKISMSLAGPT
jgi:hypothetical protein